MRRAVLLVGSLVLVACARRAPPGVAMAPAGPAPAEPAIIEPEPAATAQQAEVVCEPERQATGNAPTLEHFDALAACEEKAGRFVDALRDYQRALHIAIQARDTAGMQAHRGNTKRLLGRVPHLSFRVEDGDVRDLQLWFDGRPVDTRKLDKRFTVDPGVHRLQAKARRDGRAVRYDHVVRVEEAADVTVALKLD